MTAKNCSITLLSNLHCNSCQLKGKWIWSRSEKIYESARGQCQRQRKFFCLSHMQQDKVAWGVTCVPMFALCEYVETAFFCKVVVNICIYIYSKLSWPTEFEGDLKAPFPIATTLCCRGKCNSFPWIASLTLDLYLITLSVNYFFETLVWLDLGLNLVFGTIGKHSDDYTSGNIYIYIYHIYIYIYIWLRHLLKVLIVGGVSNITIRGKFNTLD